MNTTENQTTFRLQNLSTGYRLRQRDIVLASGLEATLRTGELTCLLGPNGAGKSTLLRTMTRFQEPLAGNISLQGQPLDSYKPNELARRVGVVLTDKLPSSNLRAEELVGMGRMPYTGFWGNLSDDDQRAVDEALQMVGMTSFRHRRLSTLSDGEQQKLMIAKALAQQTPVILLDEPVAFLDFPSKVEILTLLRRLAREKKKAVLLSIHDLELALQTADRLWLLDTQGRLTQGTPAELAHNGSLNIFFTSHGLSFDPETMQYSIKKS